MKVAVQVIGFSQWEAQLRKLDALARGKVIRDCVEAPAKIAAQRMRELCPSSAETGTRQLLSKGAAAKRAGAKHLRDTIGIEIRNYGLRMVAYVGPQMPAGVLINAVYKAAQQVLWGRRTAAYRQPLNFVQVAGDQTAGEQKTAAERAALDALKL